MKKVLCLLVLCIIFLCGCSKMEQTNQLQLESFSYDADFSNYEGEPGVKQSDFININKTEITSTEQVIDLAKKECTIEYNTIAVALDIELKIYRVSFYQENRVGANQDVYINQEGITQLIVYGE